MTELTERRRVDAYPRPELRARPRPKVRDGLALEHDDDEGGHHLQDGPRQEGVDGPPYPAPVAAEAEQEDEDGALGDGEDRVVDELRRVVPDDAGLEVGARGDVGRVYADEHLL